MEKRKSPKQLKNKIDQLRREYIRNRDSDFSGYAKCISCGAIGDFMDAGHYYSRRHDWSTELGGDERNVNLQCVPCNSYKRGFPQGYAMGLKRKYGDILEELEQKYRTPKKWKVKELEELLDFYKQQVKTL